MIPKLIQAYIEGASKRSQPSVEVYPLYQVGTFRVFGGVKNSGGDFGIGNRYKIKHDTIHGRFVDAIAYALHQGCFSGWNLPLDVDTLSRGRDSHGYLERVEVKELTPSKELDALL